MRQPTIGFLLALGSLLACIPSCNDEDGPRPCDWNHLGAVHGYVLAAGQPPAQPVAMRLRSTEDPRFPLVDVTVDTDSTGWYELLAPKGAYFLTVSTNMQACHYTPTGLVSIYDHPSDTLIVSHTPVRADIDLGAMNVDLTTPAVLDSQWIRIYLVPPESSHLQSAYVTAAVDDGHCHAGPVSLMPASYRIRIELDDQELWLPGTLDSAQATQLEVGSSTPIHCAGTLNDPWILKGEIQGQWQSMGFDSPRLTAFTQDSTSYAETYLAEDGSFRMALLLPVPVRLLVNDYDPWCWIGGTDLASAEEFIGASGESVTVPTCVYGAIECWVESPDPAWEFRADLALLDASGGQAIPFGFRAPRRTPLTIPMLQPGTYFLRLTPQGSRQSWCAQWFDQVDELADAVPIAVPPDGGLARITMTLSTCGTISGRVLEPDGSPAGGRRVELFAADDPSQGVEYSGTYTVTHADTGEFALLRLHDGAYRIGVRHTMTTLVWYPGTLLWDEAEILTLAEHGEITGLEWSLVE
jgi:hypothetical protein